MVRRLVVLFLASMFTLGTAQAQWLTKADIPLAPKASRHAASTAEDEQNSGPMDALKWYWGQRTFGLGYIPQDALGTAHRHTEAMRILHMGKGGSVESSGHYTESATAPWTLVGPNNIGGRVNAIAIHPTDPKTIYAGAANGGVWKTIDGGASWKPLTDQMQSLAMGAIGIDPQVPSTVYAGTGEYSPAGDAYSGYGLLKSTDGGDSWMSTGLLGVGAYTRIIVNPKHSNIVYAAAGRGGGGVLRSTDAGASWTRVLDSGAVSDMALAMNGDVAMIYAGVPSKAVFLSKDGGNTWNKLSNLPFSQMRRLSVDVSPTNWQNVAVLSIDTNSGNGVDDLEGIQRSQDGGNSWTEIDGTFSGNSIFTYSSAPAQGWYDSYIRMDPADPQHLLLGALSIWETKNGGSSWTDVARSYHGGIHPDQHDAAFAPSQPSTVVVGNDGGVFTSTNGGSNYNVIPKPMAITEFYGIGIDQTLDVTYGGAQDNGSSFGTATGAWSPFGGGDGAFAVADPQTSGRVYWTSTDGLPEVYDNGNTQRASTGIVEPSDSLGWTNPFIADPKTGVLYFGCKHLYTSGSQGGSWSASSRTFGFYGVNSTISAIGSFGDRQTLAVGTGGGLIYYTTNAGSNWSDMSTGLPGRFVTWIQFDPSSKSTFYITLSGFGAGHVFKTTDGGNSWVNVSSTLPDIPVNTLVMDPTNPSALYIGTDVGVFFSPDGGAEWIPYGSGLPNTAVLYLAAQDSKRVLRAGTHGRSIWEVPMVSNIAGIASPSQRTVWAVGDTANIVWHGFGNTVTIDISIDGGASWQNLATGRTGTSLKLDTVKYSPSLNMLVKVSDGSQTVISPLFEVIQRYAGAQLSIVGELPYYLYDIAYDKDLGVLWATNFSSTDNHLYKIDPDKGTVLDSIMTYPKDGSQGPEGYTGIKYDPKRQRLVVQRVYGPSTGPWSSKIFEISKTGAILKTVTSPAFYGTGIFVNGTTVLVADRLNSTINQAPTSNYDFTAMNPISFTRTALYGPRSLSYDTKQNLYLLAYTDFEGTGPSDAHLNDSYVLFLDPNDGHEVRAATILDPSAQITNIRGMEYDPRGLGNTAWITTLAGGGGAKIVKIALEDGPSSIASQKGALAITPSQIDFGNVDTMKSKTIHAQVRNSGDANLVVNALQITPSGTAFSAGVITTPITLKPGDTLGVDLIFAPTTGGQQTSSLTATYADGTSSGFVLKGTGVVQHSGVLGSNIPAGYELEQTYPNPFSTTSTVPYTIPVSGEVEIRVLDNLGRVVFSETRFEPAGDHEREISIDSAPNGNYVYELRVNGVRIAARKMTLLR